MSKSLKDFVADAKSRIREISVADATAEGNIGPDYGPTEIGAGVHLLIIGLDVGIEPFELLDFVTGLVFIDLRDDDL